MTAALQLVNDQPAVLGGAGGEGGFQPAELAGCADPVFLEAQGKHRAPDLTGADGRQGPGGIAGAGLGHHRSCHRRSAPIPEEQGHGHAAGEAHADHRHAGRFRHLSAVAVQLLLRQFPDLLRDDPIPAEADLPQLLLETDLQAGPKHVGRARRAEQQGHHDAEALLEEVLPQREGLLGETRQLVQKDQRRPRLPLHVELEAAFALDAELSPLLPESQGGWLVLHSRQDVSVHVSQPQGSPRTSSPQPGPPTRSPRRLPLRLRQHRRRGSRAADRHRGHQEPVVEIVANELEKSFSKP